MVNKAEETNVERVSFVVALKGSLKTEKREWTITNTRAVKNV